MDCLLLVLLWDVTKFSVDTCRLKLLLLFLVIVSLASVQAAPALHGSGSGGSSKIGRGSGRRIKNMEEMANMFEGDMILSKDQAKAVSTAMQARGGLAAIVGDKYRWDDRVLHYEISDDYDDYEREIIEGAMEEIGTKTCIKFEERDGEEDFIRVEDGNGCSSKVGKRGGEQAVTLSRSGCVKHGVAIHELVHAIGFWHEQSRTDRDNYVDIIWKNIEPGKNINFSKYLKGEVNENKVPYDYESVMHYRADAFQHEDTDDDTIVPKDADAEIGQRKKLSDLDAMKINLMYCPELLKNGTYTPISTPAPAVASSNAGESEEGEDQDAESSSESNEDDEDNDDDDNEYRKEPGQERNGNQDKDTRVTANILTATEN